MEHMPAGCSGSMCAVCHEEMQVVHDDDDAPLSSIEAVQIIQGIQKAFTEDTSHIKKLIARRQKAGKDPDTFEHINGKDLFDHVHHYIEQSSTSLKGKFASPEDLQMAFLALKDDAVVTVAQKAAKAAIHQALDGLQATNLTNTKIVPFDDVHDELQDTEFSALPVTKLPCGHIFHSTCIQGWIEKQPTCPICRAKVYTPVVAQKKQQPSNVRPVQSMSYTNHPLSISYVNAAVVVYDIECGWQTRSIAVALIFMIMIIAAVTWYLTTANTHIEVQSSTNASAFSSTRYLRGM